MGPSIPLLSLSMENSTIASNENPVFFTRNKDNNATNQHSPQSSIFIGFSCKPHVLRTKGGKRQNSIQCHILVLLFISACSL